MLKVFCVRVKTRRKQTKSSRVTAAFDVMGIVLLYSIPIKILIWVIFISVFKRPLRVVMFQPPVNYNQRDKPKQFSAPSSVCKTKTNKKKKKLDFYRTAALYKYIWILNFHLEWCTTGPGWTEPQSVKSSFKTKIHQIVHCNYYNDCAISSALCNLSSTLKVIKSSARFNNTRHCSHSSLLTQVSDRLHSSENPVPETVCFLHPSTLEFQQNKNYDITVLTPRFSVWVFASSSHEPCKTGSPLYAYPPPPWEKWLSPTLFPPDECKHLQTSLKVST